MFINLNVAPVFQFTRACSVASVNTLFGWLLAVTVGLVVCSSASAGIVFNPGTNPTATGNFSGVRYRNFTGSTAGTVYIGRSGDLASSPRGNNQNVAWSRQTYDFSYTYDPVQKMATTTWTGRTTLVSNTSFQSLSTIPTSVANLMTIQVRNTGTADLILNLSSINSVGRGGVLSGTNGSTIVTGGSQSFTGATWNGANNANLFANLYDLDLFNSGFQLFGTIQVGSSGNFGNNESSKIEIGLKNASPPAPVVPEPSMLAMSLGLAAAGWRMTRRRRRAV